MIKLENKRVVLIGGAGFIGHHLARRLRSKGAEVSVVDGLTVNSLLEHGSRAERHTGRYRLMIDERLALLRDDGVTVIVQDARDEEALVRTIRTLQPDVLVHLAGISHAGRCNREPSFAFGHALNTLQNALAAGGRDIERFVYFSSSMVYGNFPGAEVTEETPCQPLGVYGAQKFAGERIVIANEQVFGVPYTIIRPSALYGERCVSRRVAQVFIERALEGEPLVMAGDGSDRLDFTYIDDLVSGIVLSIENESARNEIFNLTYGAGRSIHDLVQVLRRDFPEVDVRTEPRDELMPSRGTLNVDKARDLLGYAPEFPLERGLARYVKWYRRTGAVSPTIETQGGPTLALAR